MTVTIDEKGNCYLQNKRLTLKHIYRKLQEHTGKRKVNLVLNADRNVKHGHVIRIMDLAKKAGTDSMVIAAQWKEEKVW